MQMGQAHEMVEVTGETAAVNTEESKLSTTVDVHPDANLPLNGRNVYDLMQLAPGAVNVQGTMMENGHGTVVNGVREDFNGFLINGVSNKDLSGGVNNTPIQDTVQEFQQLQLNMSAQYGSSAGSINNLVTKSGTNAFHGSLWEYFRNDAMDANQFFMNQAGARQDRLCVLISSAARSAVRSSRTNCSSSVPTKAIASRPQACQRRSQWNHRNGGRPSLREAPILLLPSCIRISLLRSSERRMAPRWTHLRKRYGDYARQFHRIPLR